MTGLLGGWQDSDTEARFLQPGFNQSLAERMQDDSTRLVSDQAARDQFGALVDSASRQAMYSGNIVSKRMAEVDAYDNFIAQVERLTNVRLENPLNGGYQAEARRRDYAVWLDQKGREAEGGLIVGPDPRGEAVNEDTSTAIFQEKLRELRRQNRDVASDLSFNPTDAARGLALRAQVDAERAATTGPLRGADTKFIANVAGGMAGSRYDPLFIGSMALGPTGAIGKQALTRVASAALTQGAYNAGLTALEQPAVQAWRRQIGMENGVQPAIEEVGFAFLVGAIPGAGIQGTSEAIRAARPKLAKVLNGTATPAETREVLQALDPAAAESLAPDVRQAESGAIDDAAVTPVRPAGVSAAEDEQALGQAIRSAQDETLPPPEPPVIVRQAPKERLPSDRETFRGAIGQAFQVDAKPVTYAQFDPMELGTDAAAFQYKGGGDAAGVTDRLKSVQRWDPTASSKVMVFEKADGSHIVADGHQRLGLAQRLSGGGDGPLPVLDGFLFKESDGWTPADVRALAAKKNMQEGSGTPLDAARVLRDRPDLLDGSLPISSPAMKQAIGLAKLSDDAFGMVINGAVPENYAAAVGQLAPDPLTHSGILQDLARARPETEREARFLIGDALAAGFHVEQQVDLFGAGEMTRTLLGERAAVMSGAIKALNQDKKLFGILADRADIIEAAGNQLARDTNVQRAQSAAIVGDLVMRLAQRTGPVSDLLNAAARRVAEGTVKPAAGSREFLNGVRKALDDNGLAALMAEPRLAPEKVIEPGSPEALAAVEPRAPEGGAPAAIDETPDLFDAVPVGLKDDGRDTVVTSLKSALDEADQLGFDADLIKACKGE